jgi:hypothetical protein
MIKIKLKRIKRKQRIQKYTQHTADKTKEEERGKKCWW